MTDHRTQSITLLLAVEDHRALLREEYAEELPNRRVIASLHHDIGVDLKAAGVHADLAVAGALDDLHQLLDDRLRPRPPQPAVEVSIPGLDDEAARILEESLAHRARMTGRNQ